MNRCRNCGATRLQDLGFVGLLAPFFLKRVFGMRLGVPLHDTSWKQTVRGLAALPQRLLGRINRPSVFVEMQLCLDCSFIQSARSFEEHSINRLYLDYRSESYNEERVRYEPAYAPIATSVGQHQTELENRVSAATAFISANLAAGAGFTVLDYGGADGKFLPRIDAEKFVFEISNIEPIAGVSRLRSESEMGTYSLVQLAHVIEHVVNPLALVTKVAEHVAPGGYLYLETPQEMTDAQRAAFAAGNKNGRYMNVHEHINSYCLPAVSRLITAAGFRLVAIEATSQDAGWGKAIHIRALGQREF